MSDKPTSKPGFRETVADEMIRHLEAGTAPWQKPWKAGVLHKRAFNPVTNKPYRGINSFWLDMAGHDDPRWMTFNQAKTLGATVQKGSKARSIEYWQWSIQKPLFDKDGKPILDDDGLKQTQTVRLDRPRVFYAAVFNAEQIDGLAPYKAPDLTFDPVKDAEDILKSTGVEIFNDQDDRAYYARDSDTIHLPHPAAFDSPYEYYSTALHEIGHATGATHRMIRDKGPFGSELYAKEELMVEMASYSMSRELGLGHNPDRHASYVKSWLSAIKEDKNYLFQAAAISEKIQQWVLEPENRQELERSTQLAFEQSNKKEDLSMGKEDQSISPAGEIEKKNRTYLAVPFAEKNEVKELGAKWDRKAKSWYAPEGLELKPFEKWNAKDPVPTKPVIDPSIEFADFLKSHGVEIKGKVLMDGKWHRGSLDGESKKENASYRVFLDGHPNGQIHNYKTDETHKWVASGNKLSPEEKAVLQAQTAENSLKRKLDLAEVRDKAAKVSFGIWMNTNTWADKKNSDYLKRKDAKGYGIKVNGKREVIIPLRDIDGRIHSLQTISGEEKRFIAGGLKEGLFHHIDPKRELANKAEVILITEGYSTGASVHEATGKPVIVAFDSGNLLPVARSIRLAHPNAKIVLMADNDYPLLERQPFKNVGLDKAKEAAREVNATVLTPVFNAKEKEKGLTDWNDFSKERGKSVVATMLQKDLKQALNPQKAKSKTSEMAL